MAGCREGVMEASLDAHHLVDRVKNLRFHPCRHDPASNHRTFESHVEPHFEFGILQGGGEGRGRRKGGRERAHAREAEMGRARTNCTSNGQHMQAATPNTHAEWPSPAPSRVALAAAPPAGPLVPPRSPSRYLSSSDAMELRGPGERARSMVAPHLLLHVQKGAREKAAAAASLLLRSLLLRSLPRIMRA